MGAAGNKLQPFEVVATARSFRQREFVSAYDVEAFLLVNLDGHPESLVNALIECPTDPALPWYPRSETTGVGTMVTKGMTIGEILERAASVPPPLTGAALAEVLVDPHFAMPLRKRARAEMVEERISIGRSRINDIVLFHDSVSRVQAWLEHDDNGGLFVTDVQSTNFTKVQGKIVEPSELVSFRQGDTVTFGDIQTRVVSAELLWEAIHLLDGA